MDYSRLQSELKLDPQFKVAFLRDPVRALVDRHFEPSPQQAEQLSAEVERALQKVDATVLLKLTIKF